MSKSNCLHRANSSATKSNCGSRRELKRVYLQWRFGDHRQVSTMSNRHWLTNQLSRRKGWGEFILGESLSQPLQPDVVLVQKGELVYQIPCRHRASLVTSITLLYIRTVTCCISMMWFTSVHATSFHSDVCIRSLCIVLSFIPLPGSESFDIFEKILKLPFTPLW